MITKEAVDQLMAKRKAAQELKDLDVDRVDGVDRPATGRNFLLFKAVGPQDVVAPRTRTIPIEDHAGPYTTGRAPGSGPRVSDDGEDTLGRAYDDSAFDRLAGANGRGSSKETGLPDGPAETFSRDRGGELVSPPSTYECEEVGEAGSRAVRVGPNFLASPRESGIAEPLDFKAPEPATVVKRAPGLFKSILDPDRGPSRTGNFFDPAPSDEKVAKSKGGGLFTSAVFGE